MPSYDFINKNTGEVFEKICSYAAKVKFLEENPDIESIILGPIALGDPTKLTSTRRFDSGFKDVLTQIHERTPGSQLNKHSSQI